MSSYRVGFGVGFFVCSGRGRERQADACKVKQDMRSRACPRLLTLMAVITCFSLTSIFFLSLHFIFTFHFFFFSMELEHLRPLFLFF